MDLCGEWVYSLLARTLTFHVTLCFFPLDFFGSSVGSLYLRDSVFFGRVSEVFSLMQQVCRDDFFGLLFIKL